MMKSHTKSDEVASEKCGLTLNAKVAHVFLTPREKKMLAERLLFSSERGFAVSIELRGNLFLEKAMEFTYKKWTHRNFQGTSIRTSTDLLHFPVLQRRI